MKKAMSMAYLFLILTFISGLFYNSSLITRASNSENTLSVKNLTEVLDFEKLIGSNVKSYYFSVVFNKELAEQVKENVHISDLTIGNVVDMLYLNGKSIRTINSIGKAKDGSALQNGITIHFMGHMAETDIRLVFYISKSLSDEFGLKMNGTDTLEIKNGFTSSKGDVVKQKVKYQFSVLKNSWEIIDDSTNFAYDENSVKSISPIIEIGNDNAKGIKSQMIILYFEKDVSYANMPYISCNSNYLKELSKVSIVPYTEDNLAKIDFFSLRDSILDYIRIDGKTIREKINNEAEGSMLRNNSITSNYEGVAFNAKALGLYFSNEGKNLFDLGKQHTLEIARGFKTPLFNKTVVAQKFVYLPEFKSWLREAEAAKYNS